MGAHPKRELALLEAYNSGMISLHHGDCLEVMKTIPNSSVDMVLCDLPYGTTACKWDVVIPFEPMWEQYWRILKPNGSIALFCTQPFTSVLITSQTDFFREHIVWQKHKPTNFMQGRKRHLKYHEEIILFGKSQPTYNPQMQRREAKRVAQAKSDNWRSSAKQEEVVCTKNYGSRSFSVYDPELKLPSALLHFPSVVSNSKEKCEHPTQKPVPLLEYLIKTYTNEGETVIDNCMGSGSTGVACVNTKRKFIGIEKEAKYFEIAQKRIAGA